MAWTPRTSAPSVGTRPYDWNSANLGQCTWYAYARVQEEGYTPPCWYSGSGESGYGQYTNASQWLNHYRSPWEVKSTNYQPVAGDIAVFTTRDPAGHVAVIESVNGSQAYVSQYNIGLQQEFSYRAWTVGGGIGSTGVLIGYLHYPSGTPPTPTTPSGSVTPTSINITLEKTEKYIDFTYTLYVNDIVYGESPKGGYTIPEIFTEVSTTGWVLDSSGDYTSYHKRQTLRYTRESNKAQVINSSIRYDKTFEYGRVRLTMPITINVEASGTVMFLNPSIGSIDIR